MTGYDDAEGVHMPDPVFSNYLTISEAPMDHVNVHHIGLDGLEDVPYHPNVAGFDFHHNVLTKYREWDGKSCLNTDIFYPAELKSVYCKDNKPFEVLVRWADCEGEGDWIDIPLGTH